MLMRATLDQRTGQVNRGPRVDAPRRSLGRRGRGGGLCRREVARAASDPTPGSSPGASSGGRRRWPGGPPPSPAGSSSTAWGEGSAGPSAVLSRGSVTAGAGRETGDAGARLGGGERALPASDLVPQRLVLGEVEPLQHRQAVVAHAGLRQRGELGGHL